MPVNMENQDAKESSLLPIRGNRTTALFMISVLGLYLELMLIRWVGTEIRIFAYLQNTVLVVCFMGLGVGCFTSTRPIELFKGLIPLSILAAILSIPASRELLPQITLDLGVLEGFVIWDRQASSQGIDTLIRAMSGLFLTFGLMLLIFFSFVPLGRILGRLLNEHPRIIWGYSVNIAGSLIGIWLFVILSVFYTPPSVWCAIFATLALYFVFTLKQSKSSKFKASFLLLAIVSLSLLADTVPFAHTTIWTPYQKLNLWDSSAGVFRPKKYKDASIPEGDFVIEVNNVAYQHVKNLSPEFIAANPERFSDDVPGYSNYEMPFLFHEDPKKVLIVGAGSGNDVAGALRNNVEHVVAVEIDPGIVKFGRAYHPEMPYQSEKVELITDDARSYFSRAVVNPNIKNSFDVVVFGLLDSHTTGSFSNVRLDNFVYTKESLQYAKDLLRPNGVLVLSFNVERDFIGDRIAKMLKELFEEEPIYYRRDRTSISAGGMTFVAGNLEGVRNQLVKDPMLGSLINKFKKENQTSFTYTTEELTDDWPYLYLETRSIPLLHYLLAGTLLALLAFCSRLLSAGGSLLSWQRGQWHFFFLGAGFLLLEVQNISKASVVLGSTWWVSAIIISGILFMILLSNLVAYFAPKIPLFPLYLLLCLSCIALFYIDLASFASLPFVTKAIWVGLLTTFPIFFSGIIFIRSFASVEEKDLALGANLMGSLFGGLLQSATYLTGLKALLLIVTVLYIFAFLTRKNSEAVSVDGGSMVLGIFS